MRVPVIILAGALGCGKTTVLNHLLASSGARLGVIINDYGDVNIDALLVTGQIDKPQSVAGGCLCCIADPSELDDALAALSAPHLRLDGIIIEASGLAEPRELARMVLASAVTTVRFGGVTVLLDALAWGAHPGTQPPDVSIDGVRAATVLAFTKTDAAPVEPATQSAVRNLNPAAPLLHLRHGRLPAELLLEQLDRPEPADGQLSLFDVEPDSAAKDPHHDAHACTDAACTHHHHDEHARHRAHHQHAHAQSVSVESAQGMCPRRLVDLLTSRPPGVARVKGVTYFPTSTTGKRYVLHAVGPILSLEKRPWPADRTPNTALVMIGHGLDETGLTAQLEACLTDGPVRPNDVANLVRFMRRNAAPATPSWPIEPHQPGEAAHEYRADAPTDAEPPSEYPTGAE